MIFSRVKGTSVIQTISEPWASISAIDRNNNSQPEYRQYHPKPIIPHIFGFPFPAVPRRSLPVPNAPRSSFVGSVFDVSAFSDTCSAPDVNREPTPTNTADATYRIPQHTRILLILLLRDLLQALIFRHVLVRAVLLRRLRLRGFGFEAHGVAELARVGAVFERFVVLDVGIRDV